VVRLLPVASAVLLGACAPERIVITTLAEGEWIVLDATSQPAILLHQSRASARLAITPQIGALRDSIITVAHETFSSRIGQDEIQLTRTWVADREVFHAALRAPDLIRSPADPDLYLTEYKDGIWIWKASHRSWNQLSLDHGLDSLRAQQREGEVILYWTSGPVWSGDGQFIGFMTNRTGVRTGTATQGIRVVQAGTGIEKTIYDSVGVSVHIDGVLGEEFVFSSSAAPGSFAVHPRTGVVRKLADGYVMGFHPGGKGIVVNQDGQLTLYRADDRQALPPPDSGFTYTSHAFFSPNGKRMAVFATDGRGTYSLHVYDRHANRVLRAPVAAGPSYGPAWASDATIIFAAARASSPILTYRAIIE
jgi:hypothetical protein